MKTRFSTLDIIAILPELKSRLCTGWRVNQVYDCDQKTYLFKLNKSIVQMKKDEDPVNVGEETANKMTLIIESGLRIHTTDFDWPKSHAPSAFATKLRKHIRNKRIEDIKQVGIDRLVDMQFGSGHLANHLLIELFDRGNLILTDENYSIIHILRWRRPTDKSAVKDQTSPDDSENFRVGQKYPLGKYRTQSDIEPLTEVKLVEMLNNAKNILSASQNYKKRNKASQMKLEDHFDLNLKDLLNPHVIYGSSLLEDKLMKHVSDSISAKKSVVRVKLDVNGKPDAEQIQSLAKSIRLALDEADSILKEVMERRQSPGYIIQKKHDATTKSDAKQDGKQKDNKEKVVKTNIDFFPILSCAERRILIEPDLVYEEYESFDKAVDVYYCNLESQKLDSKALVAEKDARKKLDNLKLAQERRLDDLAKAQKEDEEKGRLIELNSDNVEKALLVIRSMIANQVPWSDIWDTIRQAQAMKDPIASLITGVRFDRNEFIMRLSDPYDQASDEENASDNNHQKKKNKNSNGKNVEIDIGLSAHANARKFFVKRRTAVNKEKKTIEVSKKAFKNVERQTREMIKDVVIKTNISKSRKRYWFENFFWFISSDGFVVVAGRDAEQNELLVKRYMKTNDIYVHADLHGAASVIIKNETSEPVPPKTLTEAGCMAVCYSSAWDSKMATTSWWVYPKQVSKSAPTGEYLTVGAFIIRGKKNFLPLSNLVLGFGFLFRLEEDSIQRRKALRLSREQNASSDTASEVVNQSQTEESEDESADDRPDDDSDSEESNPEEKSHSKGKHMEPADPENEAKQSTVDLGEDDEDLEDDDDKTPDYRLIDTLTENPMPDDTLLYSIPMCGPYSAFQNFKYKVKVIPGANKRGKAAKACLGMFLHDKRATQRERDLLRALKDQDYARNIPNHVKISSANMKTLSKVRPKKSELRLPRR